MQWLATHHEPLILEELHRVRATVTTFAIRRQLEAAGRCGRGWGSLTEQLDGHHASRTKALRPHLWQYRAERASGVSAVNLLSQLKTPCCSPKSKTHASIMKYYFRNLTTGVVAADADGRITVFNQEAAQIAGLNSNGGERTVDDLPAPCAISFRLL